MGKVLSLFTFIDALGWRILKKHRFLDDVLPHKAPLGTIFGYSSTCDPTIITGKLPRDHGHFSFFAWDPSASPFALLRPLALLPKTITRRGRVRRLMSRLIQKIYGYTGYFQIYNMPFKDLHSFDYTEKRDLYQEGGINGGCPTIFDFLRAEKIPFHLSDWRRSETVNLASLREAVDRGEPRFAYLYMAAMDALLHEHGTDSPLVQEKLDWYETELRRVLDRAHRSYDAVRLFVFSDHGMTDCHGTCDLMKRIDGLGLRFGEDFAAVYDSTMARFWFFNDLARKRIERALAEEPLGEIMSDERLHRYGCDFPDRRYGELFFLMKPGVLLCPSFMGESFLRGMHGYAPEDPDSVASFSTNVELGRSPARLDDLYDLMHAEALGLDLRERRTA